MPALSIPEKSPCGSLAQREEAIENGEVMLSSFFIDAYQSYLFLPTRYNLWLVALSLLVAIFTSCLALQIAGLAREASERWLRWVALATGSCAMGGGIWAMHFVGMLAFSVCSTIQYALLPTLLSMLPAVAASLIALHLLSQPKINGKQLLISGVLVGSGIGTMHYSGMAAIRMTPLLRYDPFWFAVSILLAVLLSTLSLWIRFGLDNKKIGKGGMTLLSGGVMGVAIAGMHYFGMEAARFIGTRDPAFRSPFEDNAGLAVAIAITVLMLGNIVFVCNVLLRYRPLYQRTLSNELKLQATFNTSLDGIITFDEKGGILSANPAVERLFGWKVEELLGKNINLLMPEPYHSKHDRFLADYMETQIAKLIGQEREEMALKKDGSQFPIRLSIGKVLLPEQVIYVGFISDISARHRIQQELEERESQFRTLIDNIPGVAFRSHFQEPWKTIFINENIEKLCGWPAKSFLDGRIQLLDIVHPDDKERVRETIRYALDQHQLYVVEYRLLGLNQEECWVLESARGVYDDDGALLLIDGVILDISEKKAAEFALIEAKNRALSAVKSKSAFLANMSHEIRTPMNAIIGYTDLLQDTELDDKQKGMLKTVNHSAKSLLGLLNDVLDTAKLEQNALELEEAPFSLREVAEQVIDILQLSASKKGISLQLKYPDIIQQTFIGDAFRVRQILMNLVGNAIKFTVQGGVWLTVLSTEENVVVIIRDSGIGMSQDTLAKLFEPFSQADASTTRRFGGTGLGTTIALQLTQKMGGRIEVQSALNKGSVFQVYLPLRPAPLDALPCLEPQDAKPMPAPPSPLNILVADDDLINLDIVTLLLKKHGHRIYTASNGKKVINAWQHHDIDLILMDVQMPVMDGITACKFIRQVHADSDKRATPIIALTAGAFQEDREAAMAAGMDGFMTKPIDVVRLQDEIERVMKRMAG